MPQSFSQIGAVSMARAVGDFHPAVLPIIRGFEPFLGTNQACRLGWLLMFHV
jgi:hypothetical protein